VSIVGSLLEAQTTALLRRLTREQETRTRRLRDDATAQVQDIVRRARSEARARLHQAVLEVRREDEVALARRRAAIDTQRRRERQAQLRRLLDEAWSQLPAALARRWGDPAGRDAWCRAACRQALRTLLRTDELVVECDAAHASGLDQVVRHELGAGHRVTLRTVAGLGAGLRIRAARATLDATIPGLLAARDRVAAELLAEFEQRAAASAPAEEVPA
jgi:vacuolar-type H+-ATPase subunit E/Vma4